jgi:hypothetical protein
MVAYWQFVKLKVRKVNPARKLLPIAALATALIVTTSACTDSAEKSPSGFQPARNSLGHPDIQGTWDFRTLTPLERPADLGDKAVFTAEEEEAYRQKALFINDTDNKKDLNLPPEVDVQIPYNSFWLDFGTEMSGDRRTSLIVDPANGRLPELTPAAKELAKLNFERVPPIRGFFSIGLDNFRPAGPEALGLSERCLVGFNAGPPLMPSSYNNNVRIVQTPNHVVFFTEMIHDARIIPIDDRQRLPEDIEKWSGDSHGYWDGDTLVIETTNFNNKMPAYQLPLDLAALDKSGPVGLGKDLHLTEKLTRTSDAQLIYEYTINAPAAFTRPFTVVIPMQATEDQIYEFACHEGNHAVPGILRGARTLEKDDATASIN